MYGDEDKLPNVEKSMNWILFILNIKAKEIKQINKF